MKNLLLVMLTIAWMIVCFGILSDRNWIRRQYSDQLKYRVELERENDRLKIENRLYHEHWPGTKNYSLFDLKNTCF